MSGDGGRDHYLQLRSDWLRFRNHLYDAGTELPTLAVVLDDVRRLLEERGTLGLLYLDLAEAGQERLPDELPEPHPDGTGRGMRSHQDERDDGIDADRDHEAAGDHRAHPEDEVEHAHTHEP